MSLRIEDYVGKKVRVTEVHPDDPCPDLGVGDIVEVRLGSSSYTNHRTYPDGFSFLERSEGSGYGTVCKFEPVSESNSHDTQEMPAVNPEASETPNSEFAVALDVVLVDVREMLLAKNRAYGNSFAQPVRAFSKASTLEAINVRIDDKLSRLMRGHDAGEDTARDLLGYLVLREVAIRGGAK